MFAFLKIALGAASLVGFFFLYNFIAQPHRVQGQAMHPNYSHREYIMTNKVVYKLSRPKRGDVVVFRAPATARCPQGVGCDFIKRVIGLPGEAVEVKDGSVFIDGKLLSEPYLPQGLDTEAGTYVSGAPVQVPQDQYFILGDNRPHSSDSRNWGPVSKEDIIGKVALCYANCN